jgi:hypothetical protein
VKHLSAGCLLVVLCTGCSAATPAAVDGDAGSADGGFGSGFTYLDGGGTPDTAWTKSDGGFLVPDVGVVPADRFITKVVSVTYGPCAGFGQDHFPEIVEGPPQGALWTSAGGTDVLSLGNGGEIIVSFEPNAIIDGDGPDFIVFENPFYIDDNPDHIYAEPAEVSVSDDGVSWTSFTPCTDTTNDPPYQSCAGIHPVLSNPENGISPFDPTKAGGDPYDLATIGKKHANYVRIVDKVIEPCSATDDTTKNGFDLDAIASVHAATP